MNLKFDEDSGIIADKATGERCIIVSKTRVQGIFEGLSRIFRSGIGVLLKESSRTYAMNVAKLSPHTANVDLELLVSAYAKTFVQLGFGKMEVLEFSPKEAKLQVRVWNNFFAELRYDESTYCNYVEGLLTGIYEALLHRAPNVKEVKCIGNGDPYCEFLLTRK